VNLNNFLDDASCFTLSAVTHESQSRMYMTLDTKVCILYHLMLKFKSTCTCILNLFSRLNNKVH
jgi:hypothetical protein